MKEVEFGNMFSTIKSRLLFPKNDKNTKLLLINNLISY